MNGPRKIFICIVAATFLVSAAFSSELLTVGQFGSQYQIIRQHNGIAYSYSQIPVGSTYPTWIGGSHPGYAEGEWRAAYYFENYNTINKPLNGKIIKAELRFKVAAIRGAMICSVDPYFYTNNSLFPLESIWTVMGNDNGGSTFITQTGDVSIELNAFGLEYVQSHGSAEFALYGGDANNGIIIDDLAGVSLILTVDPYLRTNLPVSSLATMYGTFDCPFPTGQVTPNKSMIDNVQLSYFHYATDYSITNELAGCKTCSAPASGVGRLPSLTIQRVHRYKDVDMQGSFGPGVFCNYDFRLNLYAPNIAEFWDPMQRFAIDLSDSGSTGIYGNVSHQAIRHMRLLDSGGNLTANQALAATAILTEHDGHTYTFQIFSTTPGSGNYQGRMIRSADRNGNAVSINYVDVNPQASDEELQYDRSRLWRIASVSDAYGLTATFNYQAMFGQWVVQSIQLPNASVLSYSYGVNRLVGLNGVIFSDGTISSFTPLDNSTVQSVKFDDSGATGTHRRKTVAFTKPTHSGVNQPSNRVRSVISGDYQFDPEVTYKNMTESNGATKTTYAFEGGENNGTGSLLKYQTQDGVPQKTYRATNFTNFTPMSELNWELVADYQADSQSRVTHAADPLGRRTEYTRDGITGAITQETRFNTNGSIYAQENTTYNVFRQPLLHTDRLGRITQNIYDVGGKGNLEFSISALGTADEAVVAWTYNARGQPLTYTDGNGNVTNYHYDDPRGFLTRIEEPADIANGARAVYQYAYDAGGRLQSSIDPLSRTSQYGYDLRNRLTSVTYNDGSQERYTYGTLATSSDQNLLLRHEDRNGNATVLSYDAKGREIKSAVLVPTQGGGFEEQDVRVISYLAGTEKPREITARGEKSTFLYDGRLRIVSTTVRPSATRTLTGTKHYDAFDRIDFETDPFNRRTFYVYDVEDRVVRTVRETIPNGILDAASVGTLQRSQSNNPAYLIEDIAYDVESQIVKVIDARGVVSTKLYDERGRTKLDVAATAQLDMNGVEVPITDLKVKAGTEYTYDDQNNLLQIKHPRSFDPTEGGDFITKFTYTNRNLPKSRTEAFGRPEAATMSFEYALDGRVLNTTDGRNKVWSNVWKQCCGRLGATVSPTLENGTRPITFFNYNFSGDLTHVVKLRDIASLPNCCSPDPVDADTYTEATTKYDARHRPIAQTVWFSPLGQVDENDPPIYGDVGAPAGKTGLTTRWQYDDNLSDAQGLNAPGGPYASLLSDLGFGVGADGFAVLETNPESESTLLIYDSLGRLLRTIDANMNATTLTYDTVVNDNGVDLVEASIRNALSFIRRTLADGAGLVRKSFDEENQPSSLEFDAGGLLVRSRDANNNGVDSLFDARGRVTQSSDTAPVPSVVKYFYDAHSNLVRNTDARNKDTVCVYDPRDRRKECADRIAGITRYGYDANNNLLTIMDADAVQSGSNKQTVYDYDERNQLRSETFPDNRTRSYTRDPVGRLATRLDQTGLTTNYVYDMVTRLIRREYPDNLNDILLYDGAGRITSAQSLRYGNTVAYTYDDAGRVLTESLSLGTQTFSIGYGYDNANRPTNLTYPDGKVMHRTFTARNQLQSVTYDGANVVNRVYDTVGRLDTSTLGNNKTETRTYRSDNLIATINVPGVTDFTLSWDANKRRTADSDAIAPQSNQLFGYDDKDRLTSYSRNTGQTQTWNLSKMGDWKVGTILNGVADDRQHNDTHEITTRNGQALAHDIKGNLTNDAVGHAYTWDVENRLSTAVTAQHISSYTYDALGRRVSKTVDGLTTIYASAGAQQVLEYENGAAPEAPTRKYAFGSYIDEPLMMIIAGEKYYYHANQQYSVAALTDENGNVVERYNYDPYGKATIFAADGITVRTASLYGNPFQWQGGRVDGETGLNYKRQRMYDPVLGRFISRWKDMAKDYNLYQFQYSQPSILNDPFGDPDPKREYTQSELNSQRSKIGWWENVTGVFGHSPDMDIYNEMVIHNITFADPEASILIGEHLTKAAGDSVHEMANVASIGTLNVYAKADFVDYKVKAGEMTVTKGEEILWDQAKQSSMDAAFAVMFSAAAGEGPTGRGGTKTVQPNALAEGMEKLGKERFPASRNMNLERVLPSSGDLRIGSYGELSGNLPQGVQANHLYQNASVKSIIPQRQGPAVGLAGDGFWDYNTPHFNFHTSMENFWNPYREGMPLFRRRPTFAQYDEAMAKALAAANCSEGDIVRILNYARQIRELRGIKPERRVPNIPRPLPNPGSRKPRTGTQNARTN